MEFINGICILVVILHLTAQSKGVEYQSMYRRIPDNYLKAIPQEVFENATVEKCAASCVRETEFECKSFDIDNLNKECHLHNHTHTEPLVGLQHARGFDHYRTAYERLFNRIPNHVITLRHNRNIRGLTVEECARRCILEITFKCLGFDYEERRRNCWLTDKDVHDVNGLVRRSNTDFYERKSNGALGKFINYGFGSLQTLEGVQTHGKIVLGVHLDACAQLCLAETSFPCASFDYVYDEQSCQLSQYIAANVHGIRTEYDSKYQVMHYELIGEYLEYFYPTPYASLLGNNDRTIWRVTPETCARKCLEERDFVCRSFDYQIQKGTCLLSHATGSDAGGLYTPEEVNVHHFEMKPSLDCGGILNEDRGSFASPNWPRHYLHHLNCTWMIEVPEFKIIQFEIYHLDLGWQTDEPCSNNNDVLKVSETTGDGTSSSTCLVNYQTQIATTTHKAKVSFVTNSDNDAQGFRIFYFADWPCKATFTKDNGEFASPRWPNSYQAMTSCHWHIQGPENSKVFLRFSSIELEDHTGSSCLTAYDKIEIYDSFTTSNHLKTLCGNRRSTSFTSSGSSLYIVFTSDSRVQAKGFHASYTFILPSTTTTTTTPPTTTTDGSTTISTTGPSLKKLLNVTAENSTLYNRSLDILARPDTDSSNLSLSMKLAMISYDKEVNKDIKLTAVFVEPSTDDSDEKNSNTTLPGEGKKNKTLFLN
ncbi:uncharacterized protein LOC132726178 [Ruditapes philippinarum]|uniref:uncharacterized protein LOC132726178 n=1 Tax=Ruditapes philippinarum TaxID=129788 RepID=UPI00295C0B28|nr:uncharacterized protein LOC132726178 [Ruditapes philippinarum]